MKFTDEQLNNIMTYLETFSASAHILNSVSDNPSSLIRKIKDRIPKSYRAPNRHAADTGTEAGLLYVLYSNAQQKYGSHNMPNRDKFMNYFMKNEEYLEIFKVYEDKGFLLSFKPSILNPNKKVKKITLTTYSEYMRIVNKRMSIPVSVYSINPITKKRELINTYQSIGSAAKAAGVTDMTVRRHLMWDKKGLDKALFRPYNEKHTKKGKKEV